MYSESVLNKKTSAFYCNSYVNNQTICLQHSNKIRMKLLIELVGTFLPSPLENHFFLFFIINSLKYKNADLLNPLHRDNNDMKRKHKTKQKETKPPQRNQWQTVYLLIRLASKCTQTDKTDQRDRTPWKLLFFCILLMF